MPAPWLRCSTRFSCSAAARNGCVCSKRKALWWRWWRARVKLFTTGKCEENGAIVPLQGGGFTVSSPLWIGGVEKAAATPAPKVGEHSAAILREHGFAEEEIAHLRAQGVVG